ncbi:MAG: integrase core domain-containing protein [bacterium]|nr:integrase core domain-containing protein [bacterium]
MPYTKNPNIPKVRRDAVNLVKYRKWSIRKVARRFGVYPSTVSRWCKHPWATGWHEIATKSSRPKTSPNALTKEIVWAIINKRIGRRRCGQVIHQELLRDGILVSLPSVQRTLDRCGLIKKRSPWKRPHDYTPRPEAAFAGALLEADTVHIMLADGSRIYVYTLIDLFSRWAYAEVMERISAERSVGFIMRAKKKAPFSFKMIQTDHGSEFSTWFTHGLKTAGINHRHSRVRQSNDNAHIERFNRTIQEECLDHTANTLKNFEIEIPKYLKYYNTERLHMGINYQTPQEVLRRS